MKKPREKPTGMGDVAQAGITAPDPAPVAAKEGATTLEEIARQLEAEVDAVERWLDGPGSNYNEADRAFSRSLVADYPRRIKLLREMIRKEAGGVS